MVPYRNDTNAEPIRNLLIAQALTNQCHDFAFAFGEAGNFHRFIIILGLILWAPHLSNMTFFF